MMAQGTIAEVSRLAGRDSMMARANSGRNSLVDSSSRSPPKCTGSIRAAGATSRRDAADLSHGEEQTLPMLLCLTTDTRRSGCRRFLGKLTLTCLQKLTAIAGAEALSHALEAFTAIDREGSPSWPRSRSSKARMFCVMGTRP